MNQNQTKLILIGIFILFVAALTFLLVNLAGLNVGTGRAVGFGSHPGDSSWLIPDSELVYGPASVGLDISEFLLSQGGTLSSYQETVGGISYSAAEILTMVCQDYSVNPRLLLAVVELESGWVTGTGGGNYPAGYRQSGYEGLYRQLSWTADQLNHGYYAHRVGALEYLVLEDDSTVYLTGTENSGTVGVYYLFSYLTTEASWEEKINNRGVITAYETLFGDPFQFGVEPLVPTNSQQPVLQLPFETGKQWSFTGGPHPAWGNGSAWAALDFAPPKEVFGCVESDEWVTAVAAGTIVRSGNGVVVLDLDGDGAEQTGWVIVYLHVATQDRIGINQRVRAGDRIGHPSCEGGMSTGTHVHIARKYQGEWIPADQEIPFNLDGWLSAGSGIKYSGTLTRQDRMIEAMDGRTTENQISR